jgi:hypothetical protein
MNHRTLIAAAFAVALLAGCAPGGATSEAPADKPAETSADKQQETLMRDPASAPVAANATTGPGTEAAKTKVAVLEIPGMT